MKKKIALIIPCAPWVKYKGKVENVRTWRFMINLLKKNGLEDKVDLYAIDCIKLKSTGKPIGIWDPIKDRKIMKEILGERLDRYPSWEIFKKNKKELDELVKTIEPQLKRLSRKYMKILGYVNVKAYHLALKKVSEKYNGKINLIEMNKFSPFSFFSKKNTKKLINVLKELKYQ